MQLYHPPLCWKRSQPTICMTLVVITWITAACFCLGWCSRQDRQVRISLLICSDIAGQNDLSLAVWIDFSTPWWTRAASEANTHSFFAGPTFFDSSQGSHQWLQYCVCNPNRLWHTWLRCFGHRSWHRCSSSWIFLLSWVELIGSCGCRILLPLTSNIRIWLVSENTSPWLGAGGSTLGYMCISTPSLCSSMKSWPWHRSKSHCSQVVLSLMSFLIICCNRLWSLTIFVNTPTVGITLNTYTQHRHTQNKQGQKS